MALLFRRLTQPRVLFWLFVALAIFAALQSYLGAPKVFEAGGAPYTQYNNYIIFKQSFFHLREGQDLYALHEAVQWDLFKYSPSFAFLFGPLALLPDLPGLLLWDLLNALVLFFSIYYLPNPDVRTKGWLLLFVGIELLTSLQNEQSNGLIAGLLIFAFGFLERDKYWLASFCLVSTVFIKLFGVVALALYLLYPNKLKLTYTTGAWVVLFTFLPLLVVEGEHFLFLYKSWGDLLANDHSTSAGMSVVGWLETWFGWDVPGTYVSLAGVVVFCLPLARIAQYRSFPFRALILASVLVWVVIFNHKAESPTFVIAVCGVALWYFAQVPGRVNLVLLLLTLVFTSLSSTDLFPLFLRKEWIQPYVVKVVPCLLVWIKITYDLLTMKTGSTLEKAK